MHTRVLTFSGAKDIDGGVSYVRDTVLPQLTGMKGFRGVTMSGDRKGGVLGILSLWETEAAREESFAPLAGARDEGVRIVGGALTVENFEEIVVVIDQPPAVGKSLLVQRVSMDPSTVDDNIAFFTSEIVPLIKANLGFMALRNMINRETGESLVGTVWTDESAMRAAAEAALERRPRGEARGVRFGESSFREILFADLR